MSVKEERDRENANIVFLSLFTLELSIKGLVKGTKLFFETR
jgi:hypothetical protein